LHWKSCFYSTDSGWQGGDLPISDTEAFQMFREDAATPFRIHPILNNIQDYTVQASERNKSVLKGFLKTVRKNIFCSLIKCILIMVINIATSSMVSRAGLRAPDCDHFYFRNMKRSEYCYMKNFTKVVKSEGFRGRSTCFASVKPCSFLELPLIHTWGAEARSRL